MQSHSFPTVLAALGCVFMSLSLSVSGQPSTAIKQPEDPYRVPAREIPVPTTLSPELRALIAAVEIPPQIPVPQTAAEWKALQQAFDAHAMELVGAIREAVGATVEAKEVGGVRCHLITPREIAAENEDRLLVHVHGGGWVFLAGEAGLGEGLLVADASSTRVLSVDYRMPPDHPFPAAVEDVVAVWREVLRDHAASDTAMFGSSAGGNITMAAVLRLKELGVPLPGALFLGTPGSDMTKTGDSLFINADVDYALGRYEAFEDAAKLYADGRDLREPLLSPVYGDLSGFPPTVLITGTRDLLLSHTVRVHRALRRANVTAELHVFEGMAHATYMNAYQSPESRDAMGEIAQFFDRHLAK